jgi:hypothetical protein
MIAFNHTPQKRKSPCANTGGNSLENLKRQYAFWRFLQSPIEWLFWFVQSHASKIRDEIERIQYNASTKELK